MARGGVLMVQGTASSAGKSLLVTGLCRVFTRRGLRVAPFKAQNMSNNAAVVPGGGEIGRAQYVQALAARALPRVEMNPVLLKPEGNLRSQVVVLGRPVGTLHAAAYQEAKAHIWQDVTAALDGLRAEFDLVIIEGAGSPAEINLKARDISNMRVARYADAPVLIVGDIDRGGVFAHLYGTYHLLEPEEQGLVKGFVINKLRGDPSLLEPGLRDIERLTGVPVVGVVPWIREPGIAEEDSVALDRRKDEHGPFRGVDVAVIRLPRIANFDDFDPLEREPDVRVRYVEHPRQLGEPDLAVLPGTKATRDDLAWLWASGLAEALGRLRAAGTPVVGICGGFQMLGATIEDPLGVEGEPGAAEGLGWLACRTRFAPGKVTRSSRVRLAGGPGLLEGCGGIHAEGYEIHAGLTEVARAAAWTEADEPIGALSADGMVFGWYVHGGFASRAFRTRLLENVARLRGKPFAPGRDDDADAAFDRLADVLESSLDIERIADWALGGRV
ncbi:MAG: cobyric acid synthase [Tepidiforma sp.]|nr:cobyric acid synthase [Tepidiforma sp.]GIW17825.1 MAG: cobyric acid synthase [Tepidiforma sp.]